MLTDICRDEPGLGYGLATDGQLESLANEIADEHGEKPIVRAVDVRDLASLEAAVAEVQSRYGRLDAAVGAAGVLAGGAPAWLETDHVWRLCLEVDLGGVRNLATATIQALLDSPGDGGRFVALASAASLRGLRGLSAYTVAKHGVVGLIRTLAADLAETGVTANAVAPGSTDTAMLAASADVYGIAESSFAEHHPIGRILRPEEVGDTVAWLCSPSSSGLTGAVIAVDGGMTAVQ